MNVIYTEPQRTKYAILGHGQDAQPEDQMRKNWRKMMEKLENI